MCRVIHWRLCQEYGFDAYDVSWKHDPQPFLENQHVKITHDAVVPASKHVINSAIRPDIAVMDKRTNKGYIIDVCVPYGKTGERKGGKIPRSEERCGRHLQLHSPTCRHHPSCQWSHGTDEVKFAKISSTHPW